MLCALLTHRRFAEMFVEQGGAQHLMQLPRCGLIVHVVLCSLGYEFLLPLGIFNPRHPLTRCRP